MAQQQHLGKNLISHSSVHGVLLRDLTGPLEAFRAAAAFARRKKGARCTTARSCQGVVAR
jgi:hypothetical protein